MRSVKTVDYPTLTLLQNEDFCLSPDLQGAPRLKVPPVRMKVDETDGVVDVDIHLPSFLSSSPDSGFGSPQPRIARHTPSLTSLDGFAFDAELKLIC